MPKKTGPVGDQEHIPGMEPMKKIPSVHAAAQRYARLRDARIEAGREEKDAHETLKLKMAENGIDHYVYGDIDVHLDQTIKAKVKSNSSQDKDDDE